MALSLALIIVFGLSADYLFSRIKLPGLIGMLIVGVFAGPYMLNLMSPGMMQVSGDFRKIALIVILLRAGFELRREALRRVGRAALIMSAVPALYLRYWGEETSNEEGKGKTLSFYYTQQDPSFQKHWEILYDW